MNAVPESIIVDSCQVTPLYLIQDPGAPQGQSYFLAQSSVEESKPVSDNLKAFYESSGNIAKKTFLNVTNSTKPRILKKQDSGVVGNNLKLASFLIPKTENVIKKVVTNNVILKTPVTMSLNSTANTTSVSAPVNGTCNVNTVNLPTKILNMNSKIVKLKDTSMKTGRFTRLEKAPKFNKPKELPPILAPNPSKHTSVQLLKLGETYHSLNQLSDEQLEMVTKALKIFGNPERIAPEPAYDPVTNTKFIYKVVSPRDLTVVGKNKVITREKRYEPNIEGILNGEIIKEPVKREILTKEVVRKDLFEKKETKKEMMVKDVVKKEVVKNEQKKEIFVKKLEEKLLKQKITKQEEPEDLVPEDPFPERMQPQITRSGRKVKVPKLSLREGTLHRSKKKNTCLTCLQCSEEFPSLYRLQKHYDGHPTHMPSKVHSNLFHCLLAIVKGASDQHRTNMFVQQLDQLVVKLRSLLPCLVRASEDEGTACTVSDAVGKLLGMEPGQYYLDIDALSCVKDKEGSCSHSAPPPPSPPPRVAADLTEEYSWVPAPADDTTSLNESESEDCARTNSVEKWPTVSKRVWKQKQRTQENAKKMRLTSENCDTPAELDIDDLFGYTQPDPERSAPDGPLAEVQGAEHKAELLADQTECNTIEELPSTQAQVAEQPEPSDFKEPALENVPDTPLKDHRDQMRHIQFHSAHFDIRSSPIKPTSTVFRKFQINPQLLATYDTQVIQSIETVDNTVDHDKDKENPSPDEDSLITNENVLQTINNTNDQVLITSDPNPKESDTIITADGASLPSDGGLLAPSIDVLHDAEHALPAGADVLQPTDRVAALANDDSLREIFRDEDLSAVKEPFILDQGLKDWILNRSNEEKSEDGFSRSTSLIEPALLHVRDDEIKTLNIGQKVDLPTNDNHDESSVLNFLDTLENDCLTYPGIEIRTSIGEFHLDLFSSYS